MKKLFLTALFAAAAVPAAAEEGYDVTSYPEYSSYEASARYEETCPVSGQVVTIVTSPSGEVTITIRPAK